MNFTIEGQVLVTNSSQPGTGKLVSGIGVGSLTIDQGKTYEITSAHIRIVRYEWIGGRREELYSVFESASVRYLDLIADGWTLVEKPTLADRLFDLVHQLYLFSYQYDEAIAWFRSKAESVNAFDLMNDPTLEDRFGCPESDAEVLSAIRKLSAFRSFLTDMQADISSCHREVQVIHKMVGLVDQAISELAYSDEYIVSHDPPAAKARA